MGERLLQGVVMGIYDRDYYRDEGPSFLGSITNTPVVCKWLILVNVAVFLLQVLDKQGAFTQALSLTTGAWAWLHPAGASYVPSGVLQGQVWRLLTYAFLHSPEDIMHIVWNMVFLWWFGRELEVMYGSREFLGFYLVAAVVGGVAYVIQQLAGMGGFNSSLGASGAVSAVMLVYAFHFPRHTILLFLIVPVPIWLFVAYSVAKDSFVFLSGIQNGTAVAVHLGGTFFGLLYYQLHLRLTNYLPDFRAWRAQRARPKLRVYREEEPVGAPVPHASSADKDEHLEAKMDAVLDKLAKHGQASLTESERQILMRASELYKRKRT